jgi:hypothetical protein
MVSTLIIASIMLVSQIEEPPLDSGAVLKATNQHQRTQNDIIDIISVRSKIWGTYQINGVRLHARDFRRLYTESGDPSLMRDYRTGKFLMWGGAFICFSVTFTCLRAIRNVPIYIGIPLCYAGFQIPYSIGKHKYKRAINRYNHLKLSGTLEKVE